MESVILDKEPKYTKTFGSLVCGNSVFLYRKTYYLDDRGKRKMRIVKRRGIFLDGTKSVKFGTFNINVMSLEDSHVYLVPSYEFREIAILTNTQESIIVTTFQETCPSIWQTLTDWWGKAALKNYSDNTYLDWQEQDYSKYQKISKLRLHDVVYRYWYSKKCDAIIYSAEIVNDFLLEKFKDCDNPTYERRTYSGNHVVYTTYRYNHVSENLQNIFFNLWTVFLPSTPHVIEESLFPRRTWTNAISNSAYVWITKNGKIEGSARCFIEFTKFDESRTRMNVMLSGGRVYKDVISYHDESSALLLDENKKAVGLVTLENTRFIKEKADIIIFQENISDFKKALFDSSQGDVLYVFSLRTDKGTRRFIRTRVVVENVVDRTDTKVLHLKNVQGMPNKIVVNIATRYSLVDGTNVYSNESDYNNEEIKIALNKALKNYDKSKESI